LHAASAGQGQRAVQTRTEDVAAYSVDVADFFRDGYGPLSTTGLSALFVSVRLEKGPLCSQPVASPAVRRMTTRE